MNPRRRPTCRGFTLIEAVATISVLAAMGSLASAIIFTATDAYIDSAISAQLHAEESIALDHLARELRKIPRDSSVAGVAPKISSVTATSINWNDDYSLSRSGAQVLYVENGGPAHVLLDDLDVSVSSFTIQVFDESNVSMTLPLSGAACNPIRRIRLNVTQQRYGVTETLFCKVFIRSTLIGGGT